MLSALIVVDQRRRNDNIVLYNWTPPGRSYVSARGFTDEPRVKRQRDHGEKSCWKTFSTKNSANSIPNEQIEGVSDACKITYKWLFKKKKFKKINFDYDQ